ncbi:hypothetical protein PVAP13_9KG028360 [Panicum virgatum]|uniref:Uncharacterized protein n=1 Tax=Panicum virgatum TaxID=38727 RepID=A0A8T0NBN8_PANVG|nr:hypothetical protein PVAP13_9KG028360 [Panicum virgatum]
MVDHREVIKMQDAALNCELPLHSQAQPRARRRRAQPGTPCHYARPGTVRRRATVATPVDVGGLSRRRSSATTAPGQGSRRRGLHAVGPLGPNADCTPRVAGGRRAVGPTPPHAMAAWRGAWWGEGCRRVWEQGRARFSPASPLICAAASCRAAPQGPWRLRAHGLHAAGPGGRRHRAPWLPGGEPGGGRVAGACGSRAVRWVPGCCWRLGWGQGGRGRRF